MKKKKKKKETECLIPLLEYFVIPPEIVR